LAIALTSLLIAHNSVAAEHRIKRAAARGAGSGIFTTGGCDGASRQINSGRRTIGRGAVGSSYANGWEVNNIWWNVIVNDNNSGHTICQGN
jgi:hypothetical protein